MNAINDYETGREIARKGWLLNPEADDEIKRGYNDQQRDTQAEYEKLLALRNNL